MRQTLNTLNVDANEKLSDYEARQLVREADLDGDNMINYQGTHAEQSIEEYRLILMGVSRHT